MNTLRPNPDWLSIGEAADLLQVSRDTLRRWEKRGKIRSYRSPTNRRMYKRAEILEIYQLHEEDDLPYMEENEFIEDAEEQGTDDKPVLGQAETASTNTQTPSPFQPQTLTSSPVTQSGQTPSAVMSVNRTFSLNPQLNNINTDSETPESTTKINQTQPTQIENQPYHIPAPITESVRPEPISSVGFTNTQTVPGLTQQSTSIGSSTPPISMHGETPTFDRHPIENQQTNTTPNYASTFFLPPKSLTPSISEPATMHPAPMRSSIENTDTSPTQTISKPIQTSPFTVSPIEFTSSTTSPSTSNHTSSALRSTYTPPQSSSSSTNLVVLKVITSVLIAILVILGLAIAIIIFTSYN